MTEMPNVSPSTVDSLLSDTHRALERMRSTGQVSGDGSDDADESATPLRADVEGAEGRVRVTVASPGRLESLVVDPRLLRRGSETVASEIMTTVNSALQELQLQALEGTDSTDLAEIAGDLERVQAESLDSLQTMLTSLSEAMSAINRKG